MPSDPAAPVNLMTNYPVLPEQEAAWTAQLHAAVDRFGAGSWALPLWAGAANNRALAAAWLGVPVKRTLVCEAGHHALLAILLGNAFAGKTIAVEALTYPWFVRQAQLLGCKVVPVALDGECMLPAALRAACEAEPVHAVYTMPTLHNPTAAVASLERRRQMVEVAREFDLLMIEDGAYGFLVADEPPRYTELAPERAFYVESLSKRVVPGLRTAFLVTPEDRLAQTELALRLMASGSSTLLTSMGCAMAADGSLAAVIAQKRARGEERRLAALAMLDSFTCQSIPHSWHVWVTLPTTTGNAPWTAESYEAACIDAGVLITGAHWFTAPGATVPHAVRVAFGGEVQWERVRAGVERFRDVLLG